MKFCNQTIAAEIRAPKLRSTELLILRALVVMLCQAFASCAVVANDADHGTLFWGNGDSLNGQLVSAQGNTLIWKAPELFAQPLEIDLSVLSALRFPEVAEQNEVTDSELRITMLNNNVLYGNISDVSEDSITFVSNRHGSFRLQKNQILNIQRNVNQGLLFLGPRGMDGWKTHGDDAQLSDWKEEDDGSLTTLAGETGLSLEVDFPKQCEVEVVLQSTGTPDFAISLGDQADGSPRVELWVDELIARLGEDFVGLRTLKPTDHKVHLRLFVDFADEVMGVYTGAGRLLGKTTAKNWKAVSNELVIEASEGDLTIRKLRISEWDGQLPRNLEAGRSRIGTVRGELHYGTLTGFSAEDNVLMFKADPEQQNDNSDAVDVLQIPVDEVATIVLSTEEEVVQDAEKTLISWKNGGYISGELVAMDHESAELRTVYSSEPVKSRLVGVRRIKLPNTATVADEPDRLFFAGGSLRGRLTVDDHDSEPIRWTPIGGRNASTLVSRGSARFQRGHQPEQLTIDSVSFPDVVFMEDGDVLPCRLEKCSPDSVQLVSPVADVRQLSADRIKAIELGSVTRQRQTGFDAVGWKRLSGSVTRKASESGTPLRFRTSGSYGHESILTGNSISFRMKWQSQTYGSLTLWLYTNELHSPTSGAVVNFQMASNQLVVTDKPPLQNNGMVVFGAVGGNAAQDNMVKVDGQDANIDLVIRDGKLHVSINDQVAQVFDLDAAGMTARGILFNAAVTVVNQRVVGGFDGRVSDAGNAPLEVSEFSVTNEAGTSVAQFIGEEARIRAMTVPRFQKDDPPTHVLLAPNGDLLRGRLLSVDEKHVKFESRLETLRFPRERVAAIIWLQNSESADPASGEHPESAVQAQLDNGYTLTMTPQRMKGGQLIGSSQLFGECTVPAASIRDLFLGKPEGRQEVLSYVHWVPQDARQPEWPETSEGDSSGEQSELIGTVAEDFELQTLNGETFRLSNHNDKVVVLDFWASWCGPCVAALPQYVDATAQFDRADVIFVAVNLEESPERIREFLERQNLSPTVALDRGSVIARRFGVTGIPHSVILGKGNTIQHVAVGLQQDLKAKTIDHIQKLLAPADSAASN